MPEGTSSGWKGENELLDRWTCCLEIPFFPGVQDYTCVHQLTTPAQLLMLGCLPPQAELSWRGVHQIRWRNHLSHETQTCCWTLWVKMNRDWEPWRSSACRTSTPASQSLNSININKNRRQRKVLQELCLVFMKPDCQLEPFVRHMIIFTKVLYLLTWRLNRRLTLLSNVGCWRYSRIHPSPHGRLKNVFWEAGFTEGYLG